MIAAVALALCAAAPATGADPLTQIAARLETRSTGRAEFVQTRTMADLERPQVARGRLVWSPAGVIWQIEQPFRTTYVMRDEGTVEIAADGSRTARNARDEPAASRVIRFLRALLRGDARSLGDMFDADARLQDDRWKIALAPRRGPMSPYLKIVEVGGADFVETVRIDDTNGNVTQLQFRNHRAGELSEDERQLMAWR